MRLQGGQVTADPERSLMGIENLDAGTQVKRQLIQRPRGGRDLHSVFAQHVL